MGWDPARLLDPEFLILSTHGGLRAENGEPIALGFHSGHWEVGLLVAEAARELKSQHATPFAGACTDPCDGRTQGTAGMMDSLPFRNDAAIVLRRLMRSLPTGKGTIGVATCDKGLPAMMMALASSGGKPAVLVPGGVTLLPESGEDAGKVQTIGARFAQNQITLEYAAEVGCRACASPGGGCQFLGTAATSQVVGEALGLSLPHTALAPSGQPIWLDAARRSARAMLRMHELGLGVRDVLTPAAIRNAMVVHAAFGGSTNLLIHLPAIAHAAGLPRPTVADWVEVNRQVPRLVDALPNGPRNFATVQVFLAGGVPEVMLQLREAGLLDTECANRQRRDAGRLPRLVAAERAPRRDAPAVTGAGRHRSGRCDHVARSCAVARADFDGLFPRGQSRARGIGHQEHRDRSFAGGRRSMCIATWVRRGFLSRRQRPSARSRAGEVAQGDVIVLICGGPAGAGMQEIYQITAALKQLPHCKHVAVLTDARFSGVSTGACIGHISPEALAGGPIGKVLDGDQIEIVIDREKLTGSVHLVGEAGEKFGAEEGAMRLAQRKPRPDLRPILIYLKTRACGPRWCRPAAAFGAAASTTWTRLFPDWRRPREALPHEQRKLR